MKIQDFHGAVSKCGECTNADPTQPMPCNRCFCRGFVAQCIGCNGTGQRKEPVAGSTGGDMAVTCAPCAGKGVFGVNKPDGWDVAHPAEIPAETAEPVAA